MLYCKYNAQGNPESISPPASLKRVKPTYLFRYDAAGKLSGMLTVIFYDTVSGNGYLPNYTGFSWTGNRITYSSTGYGGALYNGHDDGQPIYIF
ncbi:MAG: hypothetical protein DI539_21745 [Flavobacterium psychrophilum]|nr:MAG: hypothetical protein DI539_21745 [Flavobacterium psychrophilum]